MRFRLATKSLPDFKAFLRSDINQNYKISENNFRGNISLMIKIKLSVNSRLQVAKYSCQEHAIRYEIYAENYYKFHITIYINYIPLW